MNRTAIAIVFILVAVAVGFNSHQEQVSSCHSPFRQLTCLNAAHLGEREGKISCSWIRALATDENVMNLVQTKKNSRVPAIKKKSGIVMRTAASKYNEEASKPSSPQYTTRKNSQPSVSISFEGIAGDYNCYRTLSLSSTPARAISLQTVDAINLLKTLYPTFRDGDLGENILIDGIFYRDMEVGGRYYLGNEVLLEVTEPIEPCANLCKLPYINNVTLTPRDRIQRCKDFIEWLNTQDGLRGWYAKVVNAGIVKVGDTVQDAKLL